jgi:hypothetical protein
MPAGDGTGPRGMGPMTGRGLGYCGGYDAPGYAMGPGRGLGRGRGMAWGRGGGWGRGMAWRRGGGWGRGYYGPVYPAYWPRPAVPQPWGAAGPYPPFAPPTREEEAEYLRQQAEYLQSELDAISQRVSQLEREE